MSVIANTKMRVSDEQSMLLDVAREFCRDKSPIDRVRAELETETGFDAAVWQEMVNLGWTGIALPESAGGSGLGIGAVVPVVESMGRAMLGTPLISTTLAGQLIVRAGGEEMWGDLVAQVAAGSVATIALLDSADWGETRITCELDSDNRLSGTKTFVADAGVAEHLLVVAQRGGEPVVVHLTADQLPEGAIHQHTLIDQTKRSARVSLEGIVVEASQVLAGAAVVDAIRDVRLLGALLVAAEATGSAASCLDTTVDYLKTRKQFGKLIGSYQALKHPAVDILCDVDSARSFVYHAATLVSDTSLDSDAETACRMAKAQASDTLDYAGDRAVQFHGGMGFTYECDAQLYIRRAQWTRQQWGDAQHHRKHLARLLLDAKR